MSILDDIVDTGSALWSAFTGPGTGAAIARATTLGYMLKEVTNSINKDNEKPATATTNTPDYGVREQVDPDTNLLKRYTGMILRLRFKVMVLQQPVLVMVKVMLVQTLLA